MPRKNKRSSGGFSLDDPAEDVSPSEQTDDSSGGEKRPCAEQTSRAASQRTGNFSGASDAQAKQVCLFDQIVMLPFRLRELRDQEKTAAGKQDAAPLDRWVSFVTGAPGGDKGNDGNRAYWSETEPFFRPANMQRDHAPKQRQGDGGFQERKGDSAGENRTLAYDRIRYAEYGYFHPFVRAFLYPTVEDRFHSRQAGKVDGSQGAGRANNRSLRILKHSKDIRWAAVFVRELTNEEPDDADSKPEITIFLLRVRRVELHLFETRIGFLTVEFDTRLNAEGDSPDELREYDERDCAPLYDVHLGDKSEWLPGSAPPIMQKVRELEKDPVKGFKYQYVRDPNFDQVLWLQTMLRRGYPPYWEYDPVIKRAREDEWSYSGRKTVESLVWLDRNGVPIFPEDARDSPTNSGDQELWKDPSRTFHSFDFKKRISEVGESGVPVLFPWWRQLLDPMRCLDGKEKDQDGKDNGMSTEELWLHQTLGYPPTERTKDLTKEKVGLYYSLLGDDRFPCMTYVALQDPRALTLADWMRLGFADGPDKGGRLPYSPRLWPVEAEVWSEIESVPARRIGLEQAGVDEQFRRQYCYDRFFHPEKDKNERGVPEMKSTRYLCSGEVFVAVGSSKGDPTLVKLAGDKSYRLKPFALDPVNGLLAHFRYHYFKMGLIAHFHRCSLLNFEDELSIAVSEQLGKEPADSGEDENFRAMVTSMRKELIKFRFRFWFSEISGQTQARELFTLWTTHLRNRELFAQVREQLNEAEEILTRWTEQRHTHAERRKNQFFTLIAAIGIPAAFYAMLPEDLMPPRLAHWWARLILAVLASICVYMAWINGDLQRLWLAIRRLTCWPGSWESAQERRTLHRRENDERYRPGLRRSRIAWVLAAGAFIVVPLYIGSFEASPEGGDSESSVEADQERAESPFSPGAGETSEQSDRAAQRDTGETETAVEEPIATDTDESANGTPSVPPAVEPNRTEEPHDSEPSGTGSR